MARTRRIKKRTLVLLADDCLPLGFAQEEESESRRAVGGLVNVRLGGPVVAFGCSFPNV